MDNIKIYIFIIYILTILYIIKHKYCSKKINNLSYILDKFDIVLNDNDKNVINNITSLLMGKNIQLSNINIKGDVNINGKLTVNNGSNFSGGRHYFQNMEKAGKLRVGAAWNIPGIYAEDNKDIILSSTSGNIKTGNLYIVGKLFNHNVEIQN